MRLERNTLAFIVTIHIFKGRDKKKKGVCEDDSSEADISEDSSQKNLDLEIAVKQVIDEPL